MLSFETMRDFLDSSTDLHKETSKMFHRYAVDAFVIPVLPVALKEGIKGKIHVEGFEGTIEELLLKHFKDNSPDEETAQNRMNNFLNRLQ